MKAYKIVEEPAPPPVTVHLELTVDEYTTLMEGAYSVYYCLSSRGDKGNHISPGVKGEESMQDIAKRLYDNHSPVDVLREK